ncbi:alr0857 family protein [Aliinostoc sp. HNIBRCY26]|uniref:alr0857 family protein n=1 Tax=Aliinostoc sp. HNIBRCY26 TaxID=3418997 RepID=UPI003D04AA36
MLKLTYTENSFHLEHLNESLPDWVSKRVILALCSATKLHLEPTTATFLIVNDSSLISDLEQLSQENILEICPCDASSVEIILKGTWITSNLESATGIFVTKLSQSAELLLKSCFQTQQQLTTSVFN